MAALITSGVDYAQMLDDFRALIRHELHHAAPAPATTAPPLADELLSVREVAALLGVTVQTIHEHKRLGRLRYHKLGSRTYFKRTDVVAALQGIQRTAKQGKATPAKPFTAA